MRRVRSQPLENPLQTSILEHPWSAPPASGEAQDVHADVHWLRMPLPFALDHVNLWAVRGADGYSIIDTGYGDVATRAAWERHFASTLEAGVAKVVATHFHPDHLGNAAWLAERFACDVFMTQGEFLTAHAMDVQLAPYAIGDMTALFASHGMEAAHVGALAGRGNRYKVGVPKVPDRYRRIIAGDRLRAGRFEWSVIPGYGHSPEHAALYAEEPGLLISGDMLLPRISTNIAVGPAEPDGDPLARFLDSLRAFEALPDDTLVLPSHGLPFRGIAQRVAQLRSHHDARLEELLGAVAQAPEPVSAAQIVPTLFRRKLDLQQLFFAMGEAIAHLNYLWHAGRLHRVKAATGETRFAA